MPLYAILSLTWGKDEISFQDIQEIQRGDTAPTRRAEYSKIASIRAVAAAHGFDYVWIDTCCIDKMSSAELSEAINSMFRWYQESTMCYAHLADVESSGPGLFADLPSADRIAIYHELAASRWFTRGWTLQELIAPPMMIFLNSAGEEIGTKPHLGPVISKITRIPEVILQGADLETASIAQCMSWAAHRKTTRPEDIAYCLMGLFGISMPMLYGEGQMAFIRLQEEIIKVSSDHTIFAWGNRIQHIDSHSVASEPLGLLARSPNDFESCHDVLPLNVVDSEANLSGIITVSNKGIHLELCLINNSGDNTHPQIAVLSCTFHSRRWGEWCPPQLMGIFVKEVPGTGDYFERRSSHLLHVDYYPHLPPSASDAAARRICVRREYRRL